MSESKISALVLAFAPVLCAGATNLHAQDVPTEQPPQAWELRSGAEFGKGGTRSFTMSADYSGHVESGADDAKYATFGVSGLRIKAPAVAGTLAPSVTTDGGISAGYGTQRIRGHAGFDATLEQDVRRSQQINAGIDLAYRGFSGMLEGSHRRTDFVDFNVTPAAAAVAGITLPSAALAGCSLTDRGIGTKLGYEGQSWTVTASGNWNSYKKADCSFDVTAVQNAGLLDTGVFETLAGGILQRALGRTAGRIGRRAQLLKSDMSVSVAHMISTTNVTVDFDKSKDEFGGATQSTYDITGSHPVGGNSSLELAIGTTVQNSKKSPYLGLYVTVGL
jgi:hypothetical protein